jgi:hypothetical protein
MCGRIGVVDEIGTPPGQVTARQQGDARAHCGGATQHGIGERPAGMRRNDHVADAEGDILEARPLEHHTAGEVRKRGDDGVVNEDVVLRQADVDRESRRSHIGVEQQEYLSEQAVTGAEVNHAPSRGGREPCAYARGRLPGLVQLLAWQAVDGADGAPECVEETVTWIIARMRRRQLVARAWAVHEFLAGLYGSGASPVGAVRVRSGSPSLNPPAVVIRLSGRGPDALGPERDASGERTVDHRYDCGGVARQRSPSGKEAAQGGRPATHVPIGGRRHAQAAR